MDRRNSLKGIGALILVGITSVSTFKWINSVVKIDFKHLIEKKTLIAELAETIIPRTTTPGAKDAKVEDYILRMLASCTTVSGQHIFLNRLTDLEDYAVKNYNSGFVNCSVINKTQILKHFESKGTYTYPILNKLNNKLLGKPFFVQLKELTVQGYCNSELGATKGLAYDYVPSTYQACARLAENQLSWATK